MAAKACKFVIICFVFSILQPILTYSQESLMQPFEFNAGYTAKIGEKIYTFKTGATGVKKIQGVISGIKKNKDNTIYMLIEFKEKPLPGAPVFFENKVIGMIYRESTSDDLFEAMPVKVVLDFMKNLNMLMPDIKIQKSNEKPSDPRIPAIRGYIEAHNYDEAVKSLKDALKEDPENAELHGWMGVAMMEMGNARQAAEEFRKALSKEPEDPDFHNGLGYAMLALNNFDEAIASFKEAIRINPKHADAHYGLGRAYAATGEIKLATKEYTILKDLNNKMADRLFELIMSGGTPENK